jgi:heptosyltransferase II
LIRSVPQAQKNRVLSLAGKTTTMQLAAVLKQCRFLITNDTGPMHLAAALGIPTVALFGSSSPAWTGPFGKGHQVIYKNVECSPCFQKTCPIGYQCLTGISVDEVYKAVNKTV